MFQAEEQQYFISRFVIVAICIKIGYSVQCVSRKLQHCTPNVNDKSVRVRSAFSRGRVEMQRNAHARLKNLSRSTANILLGTQLIGPAHVSETHNWLNWLCISAKMQDIFCFIALPSASTQTAECTLSSRALNTYEWVGDAPPRYTIPTRFIIVTISNEAQGRRF